MTSAVPIIRTGEKSATGTDRSTSVSAGSTNLVCILETFADRDAPGTAIGFFPDETWDLSEIIDSSKFYYLNGWIDYEVTGNTVLPTAEAIISLFIAVGSIYIEANVNQGIYYPVGDPGGNTGWKFRLPVSGYFPGSYGTDLELNWGTAISPAKRGAAQIMLFQVDGEIPVLKGVRA